MSTSLEEKIRNLNGIKEDYKSDSQKSNLIDKLIKLLQIEESHDVAVRYLKDIDTQLHDVNVCENNGTTISLNDFKNQHGGGNRRKKKNLSRSKRYKSNRIKSKKSKYRKSKKYRKSRKYRKYMKSKKR